VKELEEAKGELVALQEKAKHAWQHADREITNKAEPTQAHARITEIEHKLMFRSHSFKTERKLKEESQQLKASLVDETIADESVQVQLQRQKARKRGIIDKLRAVNAQRQAQVTEDLIAIQQITCVNERCLRVAYMLYVLWQLQVGGDTLHEGTPSGCRGGIIEAIHDSVQNEPATMRKRPLACSPDDAGGVQGRPPDDYQ
jgi:hypothetical protein